MSEVFEGRLKRIPASLKWSMMLNQDKCGKHPPILKHERASVQTGRPGGGIQLCHIYRSGNTPVEYFSAQLIKDQNLRCGLFFKRLREKKAEYAACRVWNRFQFRNSGVLFFDLRGSTLSALIAQRGIVVNIGQVAGFKLQAGPPVSSLGDSVFLHFHNRPGDLVILAGLNYEKRASLQREKPASYSNSSRNRLRFQWAMPLIVLLNDASMLTTYLG